MAREKFVVRLLDADAQLLAWAEVQAEPRPQERGASCPYFPIGITVFPIEQAGTATEIAVHWCDLDIARRRALLQPTPVEVGQQVTFTWMEPVWLVAGMHDVPLPPVTIGRSTTLVIPVGQLVSVPE